MFSNIHSTAMYLSNLLYTGNSYIGHLVNSEDPDEIPHNADFHQGLYCLLRYKRSSDKNVLKV